MQHFKKIKYFNVQKFNPYFYCIYAVIIFICINILGFSWFKGASLDVTAEQRFGVSNHSIKIMEKIPEYVDLKLYISNNIATQMPTMKNYVDRIKDFLKQLEQSSDSKLRVSTIMIDSFSEDEDQAVALGLQPIPTKDGEGIFFGIIAENMLDGEGVIPFLSPEREAFVEYDIARLIQGVTQTDKIKIAITSSLPLETGSGGTAGVLNGQSNPYYSFENLKKNYDLMGLSEDYKELLDINKRPKIALILHPRSLSKQASDNLKTYMATGGRALIVVDPFCEALPLPVGSTQQNAEVFSDIPELFKLMGISYNPSLIVMDKNLARKTVNPQTAHLETYLTWLKLTPPNFNRKNPAMMAINELSLSTAGFINRDPNYKGNLIFTPLIYSLKKADFVSRELLTSLSDLKELDTHYTPKTPYNLAVFITGQLQGSDTKDTKNMAAIIIADSDFLDDRLWLQKSNTGEVTPFADNVNLLLNYVDFLAGDEALLALRGKKVILRPLDYLDNIKAKAHRTFVLQEKLLKQKIEKLRSDITDIQKNYGGASGIAPPEKIKHEVNKFSGELVISRKKLREVRRNTNLEIQNSVRNIKLINMIIVPLGFGIFSLSILIIRRIKAKKNLKPVSHSDDAGIDTGTGTTPTDTIATTNKGGL